MPGTIEFDLGSVGFNSGFLGDSWARRFYVKDMDAVTIPEAIAEVYTLTPQLGDPLPAPLLPTAIVRNVSIEQIENEPNSGKLQAWGTVQYESPTPSSKTPSETGPVTVMTSSAGVIQITTSIDEQDNPIQTTYDNVTMQHEVEGFEVVRNFTCSRPENADPRNKNDIYAGKLNFGLWNGYADRTVMCMQVQGDQADDSPGVWQVTYTFQARDSWEIRVPHEDPFFPGKPLPGATGAELWTGWTVPSISFAGLNIVL